MLDFLKIITSTLFFFLLLSCNKNVDQTLSQEGHSFNESRDFWKDQKKEKGNSYMYTSTRSSVFGFGGTTEITVINDKVTKRAYQGFTTDENTGVIVNTDVNYIEENEDVGTNEPGFTPLTIDELYESCASEYLTVNESENFIYFETEPNGLINHCSYFPKNCQDDCSIGFTIHSFEFL